MCTRCECEGECRVWRADRRLLSIAWREVAGDGGGQIRGGVYKRIKRAGTYLIHMYTYS